MTKNGNNKKVIVTAVIFVVLIAVVAVLYFVFSPKASQGSKKITVTVVDNNGEEKVYESRTDAEYLRPALEEIEDLKIEGTEGEYGLYVDAVNGVTADYEADGAYWSFYLNDEYCNYSIEQRPVSDGDAFTIKYEVWTE